MARQTANNRVSIVRARVCTPSTLLYSTLLHFLSAVLHSLSLSILCLFVTNLLSPYVPSPYLTVYPPLSLCFTLSLKTSTHLSSSHRYAGRSEAQTHRDVSADASTTTERPPLSLTLFPRLSLWRRPLSLSPLFRLFSSIPSLFPSPSTTTATAQSSSRFHVFLSVSLLFSSPHFSCPTPPPTVSFIIFSPLFWTHPTLIGN